jgi:hypothetical protein
MTFRMPSLYADNKSPGLDDPASRQIIHDMKIGIDHARLEWGSFFPSFFV